MFRLLHLRTKTHVPACGTISGARITYIYVRSEEAHGSALMPLSHRECIQSVLYPLIIHPICLENMPTQYRFSRIYIRYNNIIATIQWSRRNGGHWNIGLTVGLNIGLNIGLTVGLNIGLTVGLNIGLTVGLTVGLNIGLTVGLTVGLNIGLTVGLNIGLTVGLNIGLTV